CTLFTAPTAFRAIRQQDPEGDHIARHDLSRFRALFLAGERCDPDTLRWAEEKLGVPVIDHYWQTETGWPVAANCVGIERLPVVPGSPTRPVPGWDLRSLDETGAERPPGEIGARAVRPPLSSSSSVTGSALSRRSRPQQSWSGCRRRGPERSCAGRCAGSPTARSTRRRRRSRILRCSTRCARRSAESATRAELCSARRQA